MNYYEIGQRIRMFRKEKGISQEQLAEKVGISVTHMSHIETGNTKLSLPVLVEIAKTLSVRTDDILFSPIKNNASDRRENIIFLLTDCTEPQLAVIESIVKAAAHSLKSIC